MRQYLAAIAGLFASLGLAAAQAPVYTPAGNLANAPAKADAKFTPAGNLVPGAVQQTGGFGGSTVVASGPGCSACGPTARTSGLVHIGAGTAMPITCSCLAAERTFLFGSCSQFFNPGSYCPGANRYGGGCSHGGLGGAGGCNTCGGGASERHPCAGITSYLNR